MSAGNHAQAVAYHARRLGIPATIVMPTVTPLVKVENTRAHGARVILHGDTLSEAAERAHDLARSERLSFVHPYDDPFVMAGQGTLALEMLADAPDLEQLVVPIGGGGLVSGVAIAAKALKPSIEIIGVEAALYPSFRNAIDGGNRPIGGPTLAEGIAVKSVGELTLPIVRDLVADIILVDEPAIERAVNAYATLQRTMAEGAGAAGLAAMLAEPERFRGRKVGLVLCGGNIDARLLASILMRGLVRSGKLVRLRVEISDSPGVLAKITGIIGGRGGNIVELYHQRLFQDVPVKEAEIDLVVETRNPAHVDEIVQALGAGGFRTRQLSSMAVD
jgi:threonine dehydratase